MRRKILFLHRWCGLILALYAILIGVSGSILVYHEQFATWTRPHVHAGPVKTPFLTTADEVVALTRKALPGYKPLSVTWPYPHSPNFHVFCIKGRESRIVYVDTQLPRIAGIIDPHADWLGATETFHSNLMLARPGRLANGYGALLTMFLSLSGIYLWWPHRDQWQAWLRWRGRRTWWRLYWDSHHLIGVIAFALLFVIAFTGAYFTWNQAFIRPITAVFPRSVEPKLLDEPGEIINPTMADLALMAQRALPGPVIHRMPVLEKRDRPVAITLRDGTPGEFHLVSTVYLDPRSGETIKVKRLAERPTGDTILGYISAIHFGRFGGAAIEALWFLMGLAMAALSATGVLLWWRGLRKIQMGR